MADIGDLTDTIKALVPKITGLNIKNGIVGYTLAEGDSLTQPEIDIFDAQVVIWQGQTELEKAESTQFQETKLLAIAIRDALNAISVPSAINLSANPHDVLDFNGVTVLGTLPNDADWSAFTNAQVKTFVRQLSIVVARQQQMWVLLYPFILAHKQGWFEIMKYIKSELDQE